MNFHEDNEIFLSQLISGMLLFKREIFNSEISEIMSLFYNILNIDIIDVDDYSNVYDYLEIFKDGFRLHSYYNYDTIFDIDGKRYTMYEYLKKNTTDTVISFLMNHVYHRQPECSVDCITNFETLVNVNNFVKIKLFTKKREKKIKHGTI